MNRTTTFTRGSGMYRCRICTRPTRDDGNGDSVHIRLCTECFELGGLENWLNDGSRLTEPNRATIARLIASIVAHGGVDVWTDKFEQTTNEAHELNLDAAQREMDMRAAQGEDMSGATIDQSTYAIVKREIAGVSQTSLDQAVYATITPVQTPSARILTAVVRAMQDAEELGGPQGQDYIELMNAIALIAQGRARTYSANLQGADHD